MDLALNNLQRLICHKIQTNKLTKPNQTKAVKNISIIYYQRIKSSSGCFFISLSETRKNKHMKRKMNAQFSSVFNPFITIAGILKYTKSVQKVINLLVSPSANAFRKRINIPNYARMIYTTTLP